MIQITNVSLYISFTLFYITKKENGIKIHYSKRFKLKDFDFAVPIFVREISRNINISLDSFVFLL